MCGLLWSNRPERSERPESAALDKMVQRCIIPVSSSYLCGNVIDLAWITKAQRLNHPPKAKVSRTGLLGDRVLAAVDDILALFLDLAAQFNTCSGVGRNLGRLQSHQHQRAHARTFLDRAAPRRRRARLDYRMKQSEYQISSDVAAV